MLDDQKNSKVISKKGAGFPDYLDFDKLRSEGINYLGKLAGKLWTDHNVHDPGITILEVLCYAILDLGYRTNLPEADILSRNPEDQSPDNNFFTPAQILSCNPLTIMDYRKMLVDIEGVRNAWLEVATDVENFCRPEDQEPSPDEEGYEIYFNEFGERQKEPCLEFLNGLYHVYIELEKDIDRDFKEDEERDVYVSTILQKVRNSLMGHRNLCEDFHDLFILCKLPTGVCADIELEENADPEKTFIGIVEALQAFFSPAPRFYTLQQLLDKDKPMAEIFAGRPHNLGQSHGFVDTEEFEKISRRKEIHLSDVFNVIFQVAGVKAVRDLQIRFCPQEGQDQKYAGWNIKIPDNHIPVFSTACSGFRFVRNGVALSLAVEKFEGLFDLGFSEKFQYRAPSPYLDGEIPAGYYHQELASFYSVQNDFPRVYGIQEGGLSKDAPPARQAQALQLKAYLLFFDQLLANYLSQLKNIRSLFSLSSPDKPKTYFINQLASVPDLQKLLFFQTNGTDNGQSKGAAGSTLMFPVYRKDLQKLEDRDALKTLQIDRVYCDEESDTGTDLRSYTFNSLSALEVAVNQLKNDFLYEKYEIKLVSKTDGCVYFYILSSSEDFALLSKACFSDTGTAKRQAGTIPYIATYEENYRSFPNASQQFTFSLELNLTSFSNYLQQMVEDKGMYLKRRQGFLNHLLARFAETFTDYALLSYASADQKQQKENNIEATERFLTNYDKISSERGKGYDYRLNGWNNQNVSGFEKRTQALAGMENWGRHSLCHFEVGEKEDKFAVELQIAGQEFFTLKEKYNSPEEGQRAAQSFFQLLAGKEHYRVQAVPHEQAYAIKIYQDQQELATFRTAYASEEEAWKVLNHVHRLFAAEPVREDVFISQYIYHLHLLDHEGRLKRISEKQYENENTALTATHQLTRGVNDPRRWHMEEGEQPGRLQRIGEQPDSSMLFLDLEAFKIDINDNIVGKPDKFTYELLDKRNRFKFSPLREFDDANKAKEHWEQLLISMTQAENYKVAQSEESNRFVLYILIDEEEAAVSYRDFDSGPEALRHKEEILSILHQHMYVLQVHETPYRWNFTFFVGIEPSSRYTFESEAAYESEEEALAANDQFRKSLSELSVQEERGELTIRSKREDSPITPVVLKSGSADREENADKSNIQHWMEVQAAVSRLVEENKAEDFSESVALDALSKEGSYVYRLVDKDRVPAMFSESFASADNAQDRKKGLAGIKCSEYQYLGICLGGDIISQREGKKKRIPQYHYQLRSLPLAAYANQELVLFESIIGYPSKEEAEKAFQEQYLHILTRASDITHYGEGKTIVPEGPEEGGEPAANIGQQSKSLVFIPKATQQTLGGDAPAVFRALVKLAGSYPIRLTEHGTEAFYNLFPCETKPEKPNERDCGEQEKKQVYYFRLPLPAQGEAEDQPHWQSTRFYTSPEETWQEFRFFLMLLCYPDNLFVECDDCHQEESRYRVYIREILVESSRRFEREADAWGKEGLQRFICVSQSEEAFQLYQRQDDCCYTFYVACAKSLLYHPCQYPTRGRRDEVINQLYQRFSEYHQQKAYQLTEEEEGYILLNSRGEGFAQLAQTYQRDHCAALFDLFGKMDRKQVSYQKQANGQMLVLDESDKNIDHKPVLASSLEGSGAEGWQQMLEAFACYFPVVEHKEEGTEKVHYCIEIKLPGFSSCEEVGQEELPCLCSDEDPTPEPACYIAWKSHCCFATCREALAAYERLAPLLLDYRSYRPLLDCDCYAFGIGLHYEWYDRKEDIRDDQGEHRLRDHTLRDGEIVAHNPQCYPHTDMLCEAIERSRRLINSEGLHVLEHILLRPRQPEDCRCEEYSRICKNETGCEFTWEMPEPDPCAEISKICFIPGADPYSFIATVALPAWPLRFRKAENRQLIEHMLYREAPAHVLLRILWLAPHDFCCFEQQYKKWGRWLAHRKNCIEPFSTCEFLEFIFQRNYECLEDCEDCLCRRDERQSDPCFPESDDQQREDCQEREEKEAKTFQEQLTKLYCWRTQCCEEYEFTACEEAPIIIERRHENVELNAPGVVAASTTAGAPIGAEASEEAAEAAETRVQPEKTPPEPAPVPLKPKAKVVNARLAKYRNAVESLAKEQSSHTAVTKAQLFIQDPHPSVERISGLLTEILQKKTKKAAEEQPLSKKQQFVLVENSLCFYLDKVCFEEKAFDKITALQASLEKLKKAKIDLQAVYQYWNGEEVKRYEAEVPLNVIKELLTGQE